MPLSILIQPSIFFSSDKYHMESKEPSLFYFLIPVKVLLLLFITQPLGKLLSFLEASIAFEGMGRPRGFRRFRKTHLENILPRGYRDRDPRYPKGVPWDQKFFLKNFLSKSYLGICRPVLGLLWEKSDFWPKNGYLGL